jgi:ubiquinone/menaquinone biosynthesis C-methylase UbiE
MKSRAVNTNNPDYVHGYSEYEKERLTDQANTLSHLLHYDSIFSPPGNVLETGCGTGAQTLILANQNPDCHFTSIDLSAESLQAAENIIKTRKIPNVRFQAADVYNLPFPDATFDHIFVCFLLEHLRDPHTALVSLKRVLKDGGGITVIEGDHGSAYYYPRSAAAQSTIQCLIDIQASLGGNSLIGRELYPLLISAGFDEVSVSPRVVYADAGRPQMVDGFTHKTFIAMVEGIKDQALSRGLLQKEQWDKGVKDLKRAAGPQGTFSYTFFKAVGKKKE